MLTRRGVLAEELSFNKYAYVCKSVAGIDSPTLVREVTAKFGNQGRVNYNK